MKGKIIKRILLGVFAAVFVVSAVNIGITLFEQAKTDSYNNKLQQQFITDVGDNSQNSSDSLPQEPVEKAPIEIDFDTLLDFNEDIVGWIYCPDTPINYPVVKGVDNNEYLRKAIDGSYLKSGSLFADYRNQDVGEDGNYIIYGHNTSGESMFGTLTKYKKQEYYDEHPIFYYLTPEKNYKVELVRGNVIYRYSDFYRPDISMEMVLNNYKAASTFKSNVETGADDKYISLSTCVWDFQDARYVVIGKLTEIG